MKNLMEGNAVLVLWEDGEYRPEVITDTHCVTNNLKYVTEVEHVNGIKGLWSTKHIPITPETVERLGMKEIQFLMDEDDDNESDDEYRRFYVESYTQNKIEVGFEGNGQFAVLIDDREDLEHIESIADLQNLIYLLTGEMPKYRIDD